MVDINNNPDAQQLDLSRFAEGLKGAQSGKEILSAKEVELSNTLMVPGKTQW